MIIYKRQSDGEYEEIAKVYIDGSVEGDTHFAENLERDISNFGIYIPDHGDSIEESTVSEGIDMLMYLDNKYSSGYYASTFEDKDWEMMREYTNDEGVFVKQDGPPEDSNAPSDCKPEYIDDESEAPEGARIYDGVQEDTQFYCSNYIEIGAITDEFGEQMDQRIEDINERLRDEHKLEEGEYLTEKEPENTDEGDHIIVETDGEGLRRGMVNAHVTITAGGKNIMVVDPDDDSEGMFVDYTDWDDVVEGVVVQGFEDEMGGQWELYERPRELYTPQYKQKKEALSDFLGKPQGVNSHINKIVTFNNGEKAIYKPDSGSAYNEATQTDIAWYEFIEEFAEDTDFAPETAATDLKNGFGSAQQWIHGSSSYQKIDRLISSRDQEELVSNNVEDLASISISDYLWGNDDRHGNNLMVDKGQIYAIDNGGYDGPSVDLRDNDYANSLMPLRSIRDVDDREEAFRTVIEKQKEMLDKILNNKEDVVNIARMVYGRDSWYTERVRRFLKGDNPEIMEEFKENAVREAAVRLALDESFVDDLLQDLDLQ